MKHFLLFSILSCASCTVTSGQDGDVETEYLNARSKIRTSRVREITKHVSQYWKNQCVKDSAELRYKYEFNTNGDLLRIDEFSNGRRRITTQYSRNKRGDFVQKSYTFYDSIGNVKSVDSWVLVFNKKGLRTSEIWLKGKDTIRVNKLAYDKKGNLIEKVADGSWLWKFDYDKKGNIVESEDCVYRADSLRCNALTKYQYDGDRLKRREIHYLGMTKAKAFDYVYDSLNRLAAMREQRPGLVQHGTEPKREVTYEYVTTYEYDGNGDCIVESEFRTNEPRPFRCTYYDYKYY